MTGSWRPFYPSTLSLLGEAHWQ